MVVFLVESPLQALNAIEYARLTGVTKSLLVVHFGKGNWRKNKSQIEVALAYANFSGIVRLPGSSLSVVRFLLLEAVLALIWAFSPHICALAVGDWRKSWMRKAARRASKAALTVLDDGFGSIDILGTPDQTSAWETAFNHSMQPKGTAPATAIHPPVDPGVTHFTALTSLRGSADRTVLHNEYRYLSSINRAQPKKAVYYFGSKYSEAGYFDESYEVDFLVQNVHRLSLMFPKLPITYVPHRADNSSKLTRLRRAGLDVTEFPMPAEIHYQSTGYFPSVIASAFSFVLVTLPKIYRFERVISFKIPIDRINVNRRATAEACYAYLAQEGVEIVSATSVVPTS